MIEKMTIEETINGLQSMIQSKKFIEHDFDGVVDEDVCERAIELLKEQEQQEQKLGKWIVEKPNSYTTDIYCSVCGGAPPFVFVSDDYYAVHSHGETKKTKYCPHCGAKMKVECDE